jgi:hypothetical protein
MLIATWPVTWVLFSIVAWFGFALVLLTFGHRYHRWQAGKPVPYVPTDAGIDALAQAVTCYWCRPRPKGPCTCGVWCGHQQCTRLTRADMEYLDHGAEMPR